MVMIKIRPSCTLKTILEITSYDFQVNLIRPCVAFKQQARCNQIGVCVPKHAKSREEMSRGNVMAFSFNILIL